MFGWILGVLEEPSRPPNMEEIYLEYKKLMYATARKFTSNVEDQKDIVQTAMERLIKFFLFRGQKSVAFQVGISFLLLETWQ